MFQTYGAIFKVKDSQFYKKKKIKKTYEGDIAMQADFIDIVSIINRTIKNI